MFIGVPEAISLLKMGKVVAVPTETVYGLAAVASQPQAVARIFEIKNRPPDNPLICHFHSAGQVAGYVQTIPPSTLRLMEEFSPGPLSYLLDLPENSPLRFATSGSMQVIVRIPAHELFLEILRGVGLPLAAPSANTSGKFSPTTADMVEADLGNKCAGIVDGGSSRVGLESSIVDARQRDELFILRPGVIGEKEIRGVLPLASISSLQDSSRTTPGNKYRHYAPDTPLYVIHSTEELPDETNVALLLTQEQWCDIDEHRKESFLQSGNHYLILGSDKDVNALAQNFYSSLSALDHLQVKQAFLLHPSYGHSSVAKALMNRIEKIVVAE